MLDIEKIIKELIDREGRVYTNDPADHGGPTKFGITQARLASWRQRPVTADDVRNMAEGEAIAIYRSEYLTESGLYKVHDPYVLVLAFDCAVLHGPSRAVRWLQQCAGVVDDGDFGPKTEVAINTMDPVRLYAKLNAKRIRFFGKIIADDPQRVAASKAGYELQAKFAEGWLNRAAGFIEEGVS